MFRTTPQNANYHVGRHQHVATPHDKHSPLYQPDLWFWHDLYDKQLSYSSSTTVTRSQTAFNRVAINDAEMELFGNEKRHHPHNLPHLVMTMKDGMFGAIPRTIVTRSMSDQLEINPTLTKTIQAYETFQPLTPKSPPNETKKSCSVLVNNMIKEKEREPDPVLETMPMSSENEEDMEEVITSVASPPLLEGKPLPFHGSSTVSCMSMCMNKGHERDPVSSYLPSGELEEASLSTDEPVRYIEQPKQWSNSFFFCGKPPSIQESSFSKESLRSAPSSLEVFHETKKEPLLSSIDGNPFSFASSHYSQESIRSRREARESRRPFPSLSSLESIGFRSPSPNSRAAVSSLQGRMQTLSMGPKTVKLLRLRV